MATLHTVNKSPTERNSLASALSHATDGSSILMIEDGVIGAMQGTTIADQVKSATANCKVYVLGPDLDARGIAQDKLIDGITVVDYAGFVDLTTECDRVQSWL